MNQSCEICTTIKNRILSPFNISKRDKYILLIDNWRPITILTIDYIILALAFENRWKTGLDHIVAETKPGFIKGRRISNNIRPVLYLLDYADSVHLKSFILLLDFYKAFDTVIYLIECLKLFGFVRTWAC